jgi:eukaryotic-like serine/threonine-protein kinase
MTYVALLRGINVGGNNDDPELEHDEEASRDRREPLTGVPIGALEMQVPAPRSARGNTGDRGRVSLRVRGTSENDGSSRFFVGEIFQGRFRIEAVLGEGGMGRVFAAHDLNLDRPVAIKMLHAGFDDEESIARFLREGKVLARLTSEHTVRAYELGHDPNGAPYIVMERVSGRAIDALIAERGPPPCEEALEYARQVCLALAEAHAFGIVHRDIKPGNILVDEGAIGGPRVMVVDFGVAKARPHREDRSGLTSISALLGTPEYMAPEQLYAAREVDHRADIWALGATLYFMLVGKPPFAAPNLGELVERVQHGPTPSVRAHRPEVPAHVEQVIARCLHRDPVGRFRTVQDLASALGVGYSEKLPKLPKLHDDTGYEATAITDLSPSEPSIDDEPTREVTQRFPSASNVPVAPPLPSPPPLPSTVPPRRRRTWAWIPVAVAFGMAAGALLEHVLGR